MAGRRPLHVRGNQEPRLPRHPRNDAHLRTALRGHLTFGRSPLRRSRPPCPQDDAMTMLLIFLRKNTLAMVGGLTLLAVLLAILFAPMVITYSPTRIDVLHKLAAPSWEHWLGTDAFGRDVLTRVLYGGRYTLAI